MVVVVLVVLGGLAGGAYALVHRQLDSDERVPAVTKFVEAWTSGKYNDMYALVDAPSQKANPKISFLADYRRANRSAGVTQVRAGKIGALRSDGTVHVPVTVETKDFGSLKGTLRLHAERERRGRGPGRLVAGIAPARAGEGRRGAQEVR